MNNLKQIGTALHGYHDVYQTFPHAYDARALFQDPSQTLVTPGGNQFILTKSWATLILPFLEQDNLARSGYETYRQQHVPVYVCPFDPRATAFYTREQPRKLHFGGSLIAQGLSVPYLSPPCQQVPR